MKKKIIDSKETQKRLFLRMKSPSAFGAAKRFDSVSFMNVPPEMARRDAAYSCFAAFFRTCDLSGKKAPERNLIYCKILKLLSMTEEKTEFILNADIIEKRNLETVDNLDFIRLLQNYFSVLFHFSASCPETQDQETDQETDQEHFPMPSGTLMESILRQYSDSFPECEKSMISAVRKLVEQTYPLLAAEKEQRCKLFSKSDSERYERAYTFYRDYYADLNHTEPLADPDSGSPFMFPQP